MAYISNLIFCVFSFGVFTLSAAVAQNWGPFAAHPGLEITTAFESSFGPDAESQTNFIDVDPQQITIRYSSSRGVVSIRRVLRSDIADAQTLMMGYATNLPELIPNTTATGLSTSVLDKVREAGSVSYSLIYDANLSRIDGRLDFVEQLEVPVLVEDQLVNLPAVRLRGIFGVRRHRQAVAEFIVYDDRKNPVILQSTTKFDWEPVPRTERVVRVTAGQSQRSAMEQTLKTIKRVDLYGIRFDFDKSTIRPEAASTIAEIAETLRLNPGWRLMIRGHTDTSGKQSYNQTLSEKRAVAVKAALAGTHGIAPDRLETEGLGASEPKGRNDTLQGRKLNRRVELVRIDR
ncbi:MAG: OmpA family protein [Anderseniella sp.]